MFTKELFEIWLKNIRSQIKLRSFLRYREIIFQHLLPVFGEIKVKYITEQTVKDFLSKLYTDGNKKNNKSLSDNSVTQIVGVLKRVLKFAVSKRYISFNPASEITVKHGQRKTDAFSETEQKMIERYIVEKRNPRLYGILICLYTGLRIGELLALTWKDVDCNICAFYITKTLSPIKISDSNEPYIGTTKTNAGRRTVPFPKELLHYLKELKVNGGKYVISSRNGGFTKISSYQRTFDTLLKKLNIRHKGFHALRHTFATRAIETNADMKTLSEILGHSSPKITMERYVHSSYKQKSRLVSKVGKFLKLYSYYHNRHTFTL